MPAPRGLGFVTEINVGSYVELIKVDPLDIPAKPQPTCRGRSCGAVATLALQRDIVDPRVVATVRALVSYKGYNMARYVPYLRDFNSNLLTETTYLTAVGPRTSVVIINKDLLPDRFERVLDYLLSHRELLVLRKAPGA